jgi:hypothetical protein
MNDRAQEIRVRLWRAKGRETYAARELSRFVDSGGAGSFGRACMKLTQDLEKAQRDVRDLGWGLIQIH